MGTADDEHVNYNYKGGLKAYWKKRTSHRLRRPPLNSAVLGSAGDSSSATPRRRRFRLPRRIKFLKKIGHPKSWLRKLRDAYVSMMLCLAGSAAVGYGYGYGPYGYGADVTLAQPRVVKEYDEKVLVEIYKKLIIAQGMVGGGESGRQIPVLK